jgi:hypothetical protein
MAAMRMSRCYRLCQLCRDAQLCAERDLSGRHNTGGLGSGRAGRYQAVFRVMNPGAARAGCAVFVMGARPRSVRTRIAHAARPQDPEVVIAHNLLLIVSLFTHKCAEILTGTSIASFTPWRLLNV